MRRKARVIINVRKNVLNETRHKGVVFEVAR